MADRLMAAALHQVPLFEWTAQGAPVPLCQLPLSVAEVERRHAVSFVPMESQLPDYSQAVVSLAGHVLLLAGARDAFPGTMHSFVSVDARGDARDPSLLVDRLCEVFAVSRDELKWLSPDLAPRG